MSQSPDLIMATVKMVLSLAIVLTLLFVLQRWLRRVQPGASVAGRGRLIKVLGSHYLGPKKSIAMVKVPGAILVLGIGSDRVNLLTRIDDPDIIADVDLEDERNPRTGFRNQLQRMMRPFAYRPDRGDVPDSSHEVF